METEYEDLSSEFQQTTRELEPHQHANHIHEPHRYPNQIQEPAQYANQEPRQYAKQESKGRSFNQANNTRDLGYHSMSYGQNESTLPQYQTIDSPNPRDDIGHLKRTLKPTDGRQKEPARSRHDRGQSVSESQLSRGRRIRSPIEQILLTQTRQVDQQIRPRQTGHNDEQIAGHEPTVFRQHRHPTDQRTLFPSSRYFFSIQ